MMRTIARSVLLLAGAVPVAAEGTRELLVGPLAGFANTSPVRLFRGAELYGHIDGGAEIYLELGFIEAAVARLERGGSAVDAEVYRSVGLEPRDAKIVVVKAAYNFRAHYGDFAKG